MAQRSKSNRFAGKRHRVESPLTARRDYPKLPAARSRRRRIGKREVAIGIEQHEALAQIAAYEGRTIFQTHAVLLRWALEEWAVRQTALLIATDPRAAHGADGGADPDDDGPMLMTPPPQRTTP